MVKYIDCDAFLTHERQWYCDNCDRRKNSKGKTVYEIGEAPCRACDIGDVLDALEDYPAANVVEVVQCKDCRWFVPSAYDDCWCSAKEAGITKGMCTPGGNDYCSDGERRR